MAGTTCWGQISFEAPLLLRSCDAGFVLEDSRGNMYSFPRCVWRTEAAQQMNVVGRFVRGVKEAYPCSRMQERGKGFFF